jgi:hypothetical protein
MIISHPRQLRELRELRLQVVLILLASSLRCVLASVVSFTTKAKTTSPAPSSLLFLQSLAAIPDRVRATRSLVLPLTPLTVANRHFHCRTHSTLSLATFGIPTVVTLPASVADRRKFYGTGRIRTNLAVGMQCPRVLSRHNSPMPGAWRSQTSRPHRNPLR